MRLFSGEDSTKAYPIESFAPIVSWSWQMDADFAQSTGIRLQGDTPHIAVSTVTEISDTNGEQVYTEISIPIESMNTVELDEWLGNEESKSGLHGELVGYNGDGTEVFVLQIKHFTIRGRISSTGTPITIASDYFTATQVQSLIAAGLAIQFSEDAESWHDEQTADDRSMRIRSASSSTAPWSTAIRLIMGPQGEHGINEYLYIAYASDDGGSCWSMTPNDGLKYRSEIHSDEEIAAPTALDFADVVWVKYIGDDGQGVGDMTKNEYDPDDDGRVVSAEHADTADSVDWSGIQNPPNALAKPGWQQIYEAETITELYTNYPILRATAENAMGTINLVFDGGIKTEPEGAVQSIVPGEALTWELHIKCTDVVESITTGNTQCTVEGIHIPDSLPLVDGFATYHVFVIRALHKLGAIDDVVYQANFAYSYGA
jgi:hypothetical protein